ncbi:hypothetical protein [Arenimonas alkanexedens]
MDAPRKIVLHSLGGSRSHLPELVGTWIAEGVGYVGVVGEDAAEIEDEIDGLCIGDGTNSYFLLTASHGTDETLQDAIQLAEQIATVAGTIAVVEL